MINPKDMLITKELITSTLLDIIGSYDTRYLDVISDVSKAFDVVIEELQSGIN